MDYARENNFIWSWQDSNLLPPDPKSDALSIRPHDHTEFALLDYIINNCIYCKVYIQTTIYYKTSASA